MFWLIFIIIFTLILGIFVPLKAAIIFLTFASDIPLYPLAKTLIRKARRTLARVGDNGSPYPLA